MNDTIEHPQIRLLLLVRRKMGENIGAAARGHVELSGLTGLRYCSAPHGANRRQVAMAVWPVDCGRRLVYDDLAGAWATQRVLPPQRVT